MRERVLLHAALALLLLQLTAARDKLTIKEDWSEVEGKQTLPRLRVLRVNKRVSVRLRMEPLKVNETLRIELTQVAPMSSHSIFVKKGDDGNNRFWWRWLSQDHSGMVKVNGHNHSSDNSQLNIRPVWRLLFTCFLAQVGSAVNVSVYNLNRTLTAASVGSYYTEVDTAPPEDVPEYNVTVDPLAKRFMVAMKTGQDLHVRLCYQKQEFQQTTCKIISEKYHFRFNTELDQTTSLSFPHLVPCVCVEMYLTKTDAVRDATCPLIDTTLPGGGDILSSSKFSLSGKFVLQWDPLCPSARSKPTVTLCWQHHTNHVQCFALQNSTITERDLRYNLTDVDKHAHMCLKFSLNGSHRVYCPFSSENLSEWEVTVVPKSQRLHVHVFSSIPASFAAQLCVVEGEECVAKGNVHSVHMKQGGREVELSLPLSFIRQGLCVQVWRSQPVLHGKRIICPDYTHRRWGLVVAVSLVLLVTITTLPIFSYVLIKRRTSVWRRAERKPVLLVCSSDDVAHVSAVCALASGLQEELRMDVRLAQWAHSNTKASLAWLGPVPWLYGQCQVVQQAGGMVLVAWSPDAQRAFLRWRKKDEEEESDDEQKDNLRSDNVEDDEEVTWTSAQLEEWRDKQREEWPERKKNASSVTAPVLNATLSSLWAGLHSERRGQGFGLVCFRGLGGSCHIPKDLRGIRRYCLPRDLSSLIHDLDLKECGPGGRVKKVIGGWCCWPRLFSKALAFWLSQRLAQRLESWLPQADCRRDREKSKRVSKQLRKSDSVKNVKKKLRKKTKKGKAPSPGSSRKKAPEYNVITEKELLGEPV